MTRKKHICDLNLGSDSMLPKKDTRIGRACRTLRKMGQLSDLHPETFEHFRSYSAVVAERRRQLLEDGRPIIHPLSVFNIIWMTVMIFVNITHMFVSTFRLVFILRPLDKLDVHPTDLMLLGLYVICVIDIGIKFNTGYIDSKHYCIVMDRRTLFWRYLRLWFFLDLASCLPIAFILLQLHAPPRFILIAHLLPILRISRIYTVYNDLKTFLKIFTESYIVHGVVRLMLLFLITSHWCNCLMYIRGAIVYYWTGEKVKNVVLDDTLSQYNKAIIISLTAFFGTRHVNMIADEILEVWTNTFIIVYAAIFIIYVLVFLIKSYLSICGPALRYQGLMNQVEEYMKYRQFPLSLKKRVRAFYLYRYQELYFKEEADLDCLSEELRDEIKLHTCRILVHKVKLFEELPASVVGTVLGCLRPEVYLANDLVVRAGDIGDCMYFIATGTVAVYSLKGVEVCHLEDGDHFGAVALVMKDSKRVATVVAVEITQLYRLDAHDFNSFMLSNPTLYARIETLVLRRMHETILLDDIFRRDRELLVEKQQSETPPVWSVELAE